MGLGRLDAGIGGPPDIERERDLLRPFEGGRCGRSLGQREELVEIDLGGNERGIEARRSLRAGESIGRVPGHRLVVELRIEAVDCDALIGQSEDAAATHRTDRRACRCGLSFDPGIEPARIVRLDLHRSREADLAVRDRELAGDPHLGRAGGAPLEGRDRPAIGPALRLAVQRAHRSAGNRQVVDAEVDLERKWERRPEAQTFRDRLADLERQAPLRGRPLGRGEGAVEVELARAERCDGPGPRAELDVRRTGETCRPHLRSIDEGEIVEGRRRRAGFDLGGELPGIVDRGAAVRQRRAGGAGGGHGTFVPGGTAGRPHRPFGLERHRCGGGLHGKAQADTAVIAAMTGAETEDVGVAVRAEGAVAPQRAEQRANLAFEAHIVERNAAAACGVGENDAAMGYRQPVDADAIGIEPERPRTAFRPCRCGPTVPSRWRRRGQADQPGIRPASAKWV